MMMMMLLVAMMMMMTTTPKPQCMQSSKARLLIHTRVPGFEAMQVWCPDSDQDNDDDHVGDHDNDDNDHGDDDDLYIIGAVCDEKVTSSLICSATVAGEIYI